MSGDSGDISRGRTIFVVRPGDGMGLDETAIAEAEALARRVHTEPLESSPRECKACRARGSARGLAMWEWRQWHNDGVGWPWQLPDHVAEDGGLGPRPWGVVRADGTGNVWQRACRPCPACNRYGMPTGVER